MEKHYLGQRMHSEWKGNKLEYCAFSEQTSKATSQIIYAVKGFIDPVNRGPIPKKLQKNCRAFLRGAKKTGVTGLSKIIFLK